MTNEITSHIEQLREQINALLEQVPERFDTMKRLTLRSCAMEARDQNNAGNLEEAMKSLRPAAELLSTYRKLEKDPSEELRRNYEACALLLLQIEFASQKSRGKNFHGLGIGPHPQYVCPWVDETLHAYTNLSKEFHALPEKTQTHLRSFDSVLTEVCMSLLDHLLVRNPNKALMHKNNKFKEVAKALAYEQMLPPSVEEKLQEMYAALEKHAAPDVLQAVISENRTGQLKRGTYFSNTLEANILALKMFILQLDMQDETIGESLLLLEEWRQNRAWKNPKLQQHAEAMSGVLKELNTIMDVLSTDSSITKSGQAGITELYESCWGVVMMITQDAQDQYFGRNIGTSCDFPEHPLAKAVLELADEIEALPREIKDVIFDMQDNRDVDNALRVKDETVDKLIALLKPEMEGADELAQILFDFANEQQIPAISRHMKPQLLPARSLMGFAAQLSDGAESLSGTDRIAMNLEANVLCRLAANPTVDSKELAQSLNSVERILANSSIANLATSRNLQAGIENMRQQFPDTQRAK